MPDSSDYATCAAKEEDPRVMAAIQFHDRNRQRTALMLTKLSASRGSAGGQNVVDGGDGMASEILQASLGFDNKERSDLSEASRGSSIAFVA